MSLEKPQPCSVIEKVFPLRHGPVLSAFACFGFSSARPAHLRATFGCSRERLNDRPIGEHIGGKIDFVLGAAREFVLKHRVTRDQLLTVLA